MRTLASVLDAAVQRSAAEITLESEQPVIYRTARGSEAEQVILPRTELFDMLTAAVSDEHQVELMLGNAIEFPFEVQRIKWWVRAVPGADAMVVRVERQGGALRTAIPLPDPVDDLSIGLDDDDERFAGLDAAPQLEDPDFDIDAPLPPRRPTKRTSRDSIPTAFESGTWTLEDFDDDEPRADAHAGTVAMPASDSTPVGRAPKTSSKSSSKSLAARRPVDAPVFGEFVGVDDEPIRPNRPAMQAGAPRTGSAARAGQGRTLNEMASLASPEAKTRRELDAVGSPDADTKRELDAMGRGAPGLAADIGEGTLVYLLESGLAEQLVNALQAPSLVLDEGDPIQLTSRVRALPPGSIIIVQREDPSAVLGWILRRLEEGFRVVLDTRARSLEGAQRILLGTGAGERAEAWLAVHPQIVVESGDSGPRVRSHAQTS
jgi:hypothetical protein